MVSSAVVVVKLNLRATCTVPLANRDHVPRCKTGKSERQRQRKRQTSKTKKKTKALLKHKEKYKYKRKNKFLNGSFQK